MDFKEKYEIYKDDASKYDNNRLEGQLRTNLNESLDNLYLQTGVTKEVIYLINELLEDKEHLDAFIASTL